MKWLALACAVIGALIGVTNTTLGSRSG